jgi:dTDP-4-dehydrorhamnose 3,5-epimerase
MRVIPTKLPDVLILEPTVFGDDRGFFLETFNQRTFDDALGKHIEFVQDNQSRSQRGVLRGLHYQLPPRAQGKLVRVVSGRVFDVAVDMRRTSTTFGCWVGTELSGGHQQQVWIPPGFAHGFLVLSEYADLLYKTTDFYEPAAEAAVRWNDSQLAITWPDAGAPVRVSDKDAAAAALKQAVAFD